MTKVVSACVAGLAVMWILAGVAQEAAEESAAAADTQQEAAPEADSVGEGETPEADTAVQPEPSVDAAVTDADVTDAPDAFPEIGPLDEIFIFSEDVPICYEGNRSKCVGRPLPVDF